METPSSSILSSTELEQLREALQKQFNAPTTLLGSQLGAFVRRYLAVPDLKGRFGGLKSFIGQYFPAEISWIGRKSLDDVYRVSFSDPSSEGQSEVWLPVAAEPSASLWSAVTNPTTFVQFGLQARGCVLMQASAGVPAPENIVAVQKLTKADYQEIATAFARSLAPEDGSKYLAVIEGSGSSVEFTRLIRERGLLADWEEFRVTQALQLFGNRLTAAGADAATVARWTEVLQSSRRVARARRLQKFTNRPPQPFTEHGAPDMRAVAMKTMAFLSEAELGTLNLPLGSVMRAVHSIMKG